MKFPLAHYTIAQLRAMRQTNQTRQELARRAKIRHAAKTRHVGARDARLVESPADAGSNVVSFREEARRRAGRCVVCGGPFPDGSGCEHCPRLEGGDAPGAA